MVYQCIANVLDKKKSLFFFSYHLLWSFVCVNNIILIRLFSVYTRIYKTKNL